MMSRLLLSLLCLGAADALHYLEGATTSTEEIFTSGTYSYPQTARAESPSGRLRET